jgi:hypothetical protein
MMRFLTRSFTVFAPAPENLDFNDHEKDSRGSGSKSSQTRVRKARNRREENLLHICAAVCRIPCPQCAMFSQTEMWTAVCGMFLWCC